MRELPFGQMDLNGLSFKRKRKNAKSKINKR